MNNPYDAVLAPRRVILLNIFVQGDVILFCFELRRHLVNHTNVPRLLRLPYSIPHLPIRSTHHHHHPRHKNIIIEHREHNDVTHM